MTGLTSSAGITRKVPPSFSRRRTTWRNLAPSLPANVKRSEIDTGLLTQLDERQSEVRVVVQVLLSHLVEDRRASEIVAVLEKAANEARRGLHRSDGIPERDPGAALNPVHDERRARLVEEQRLVAEIDEEGAVDACSAITRAASSRSSSVGTSASGRAGADEPRHRDEQHERRGADRGPQEARRFGFSANCHHKSFEYSTCRKAKKPSHIVAPNVAATAAIQGGEKGVSRSAAFRWKAGRARPSARSSTRARTPLRSRRP